MNKKLQKQIKAYAGFAGAILGAEKLSAQVIVTDYTPPISMTVTLPNDTDSIAIDVNTDGLIDFRFQMSVCSYCYGSSCWGNEIWVFDIGQGNKIKLDSVVRCFHYATSTFTYKPGPDRLSCNDLIDGNGTWEIPQALHFNGMIRNGFGCNGASSPCRNIDWIPYSLTGILGIKLNINGTSHFGWLKLQLNTYQTQILQSGYQLQANVPVIACDTTNLATGISENNLQFNFSHQNNSIHISSFQNIDHSIISVYDLLGKEILQQPFEGKETTIVIDKKGIYFVEVKGEKGVFRKKVFIY